MSGFFYVFLVCILILVVLIAIASMFAEKDSESDGEYRDEKGRHIYYDRSLIEKEEFRKQHPEISNKEIRSFRRLFSHIILRKK